MGGDGGSIPKRGDVVKTAGYKFVRNLGGMGYTPNTQVYSGDGRFSKNEIRNLRWSRCAISEEILRKPIVACKLGNLYNKESVLSRLLQKTLPPHAKHIKSLKDVVELKNVSVNNDTGFLICPILLTDLEGGIKGFINWSCGCIISEKALKNLDLDHEKKQCLNCGKVYKADDLIPLLPDEEQRIKMLEVLHKSKVSSKRHSSEVTTSNRSLPIHDAKQSVSTKRSNTEQNKHYDEATQKKSSLSALEYSNTAKRAKVNICS